jgi:hypothetical protein
MFKITKLKTWLTAFCFLLAVLSQAQTANPYWALPPNYIKTNPPGGLTGLPTNTYSIGGVNTAYQGSALYDWDGQTVLNGPNNMYTDASGNILFSIMSGYLFNKNGYLIDTLVDTLTLAGPFGSGSYPPAPVVIQGYAEACVVPNPANCQQYFVFTALPATEATQNLGGYDTPNGGPVYNINACYNSTGFHTTRAWVKPYFTKIDVSVQGSYMPSGQLGKNLKTGAVGTKATAGDLFAATSTQGPSGTGCFVAPFKSDIHYAATTLINKSGLLPYRLLFVITDDELITYKITGTTVGTNTTGVQWLNTEAIGSVSGSVAGQYTNVMSNATELEVYQDYANNNIKVAFGAPQASSYSGNNTLVLAKYDTTGAYISGSGISSLIYNNTSGPFFINGVEFSPNGTYVYVTHTKTSTYPNTLERITFSSPAANSYSLSTATSYQYSQIEIGTDGYLYLLDSSGTSPIISKISNPNSSSSVATTSLSLSGYPLNYPGGDEMASLAYFLPDQIDQEIYSNILTAPKCCLVTEPYDKYSYSAGTQFLPNWTTTATTQTWTANTNTTTANNPLALQTNTTSTVIIGEELRIPANHTVTINNMTIKFSPQARLIVENGATSLAGGKLILNNCTLTVDNRCGLNDMWPGVQVWGTPASAQTGTYQGFIQMTGTTVIENAYVAVLAGYDSTWISNVTPYPGAPVVNPSGLSHGSSGKLGGGGIVEGVSTTFLNNQRGAVYYDYVTTSLSAGQKLQTCTFNVNSALLNTSFSPRYFVGLYNHTNNFAINGCTFTDSYNTNADTGIYTSNSTAWVDQNTSTTRSIFTTLLYGIYGINTPGNTSFIHCKNSTFNNNFYGIYLGNINNAIVELDTFKVFVSTCTGHCSHPKTYGLYLDIGTSYAVKDNYFTRYGTSAQTNTLYGIIANNAPYANVIFRNTFDHLNTGNQAQFQNYVYNSNPLYAPNSNGLQYICNTFTNTISGGKDIYVPSNTSSDTITYQVGTSHTYSAGIAYQQGALSSTLTPVSGNSFDHVSSGNDFYIAANTYTSNLCYYCPSGTCTTSLTYPQNAVNLGFTIGTTNTSCSTINTYTCGGCRTTQSTDPMQAVLDQADAYKATYDNLVSEINNSQGSDTTQLASQISDAFTQRHLLLDEVIRTYLSDTVSVNVQKGYALMKVKALELPARNQVEVGVDLNDTAMVTSALSQVANEEGQSNFVKLHTIFLQNLGKSAQQLMSNPSVVSAVQTLAMDSSDRSTYLKANTLLQTVGLSKYKPYIQVGNQAINGANERKVQQQATTTTLVTSESTLINSPNPFKESTTVKAVIVEKTQNAFVVITDMVGNEVARYPVQQGENNININAGGLNQAVMFCTLVVDGVKIKTNKMVLIK